jgi:hypothetical protein
MGRGPARGPGLACLPLMATGWLCERDRGPGMVAWSSSRAPRGTPARPGSRPVAQHWLRAVSAAQRQGSQPSERSGELGRPGPAALQAQDDSAGVAHHPCSDVEQPIAQGLGLGRGQLTVQQQGLDPAGEVWAARTSSSQTRLRRRRSKGSFESPVALAARMRSSTRAHWRCRSSRLAMSGSGWSVRKTWKRWPCGR